MKRNKLKVNRGAAIPLGNDYFLMKGATHEQGGIDIGKDLEVENGEIIKVNPKSIKILSNAPIMNGISPAQMALGGFNSGNFENRFNKGFRYQEAYKDKHKLNDDGTKKRCGGKKKKLIGGEEDKIPEFKLGELPSDYPYYEEPFGPYTLHHTTPNSPYRPLEHDYAFSYINYDIKNGESYLYNKFIKDNSFYKDKEGNYYRYPYKEQGVPNPDIYTEVPYSEIRKMLPKRDYIGGSEREVGIKVIDKVPGLKDEILRLSKVYGISPNVFTNRLVNEGLVQAIAYDYNITYPKYQKEYDWSGVMKRSVSGYGDLGLDTFGNYNKEGKLNLRRPIQYGDYFTTNEDKTGREYNSAYFENVYDALEAQAAMLEYFTKVAKKRNISENDLDAYVNAMYNMGEYHKDLNNIDYVRREYGFEPYYKLGGEMKNKQTKRNVSSTGGKKKALLGMNFRPNIGQITLGVPKNNIPNYITGETKTPWGTKNIITGEHNYNLSGLDGVSSQNEISFLDANPNFVGNVIQGIGNIGAAAISGLVNRGMLNDLKYRPKPTLQIAPKLKTSFNTNDIERDIDNALYDTKDLINKNTASSNVAVARTKKAISDALKNRINVNVQKENIVNQLINQDILNRQGIIANNIKTYDDWLAGKQQHENQIAEAKSENVISGIQTGTQALSDFITNNAQWRNQMANIAALSAAYPNVTPERLAASGLPWPLYIKQRIAKGKKIG